MVTLDMNLDEELDYREMVRGMEAWKRQRREEKRKALSRESTSVSLKSGQLIVELSLISVISPDK